MDSPGSPGNNLLNIHCYLLGEGNRLLPRRVGITVANGRDYAHHRGIRPVQAKRVVHHVEPAPIFASHYTPMRLVPVKNDLLIEVLANGVQIHRYLAAVVELELIDFRHNRLPSRTGEAMLGRMDDRARALRTEILNH